MDLKKEIYLVRHGESLSNIGMDIGFDPVLSPLGRVQAHKCADFIYQYCGPEALIMTSPFNRCVCTAEIIAEVLKAKLILEPSLHEYFKAEWFPLKKLKLPSLSKIAAEHPLVNGKYQEGRWWPEKNELEADMSIRIAMFRNRLLGMKEQRIICVGHWASIEALGKALAAGIQFDSVENASVTRIDYDGRKTSCVYVNDVSFLR